MSRFSLLAGSVALLAISGVNAGLCRPSSSLISSGLETATTSTEVSESTATLASTLTSEGQVSETLSVAVSTTEGITTTETSAETTTIAVDATTTEAATTTVLATTSAAPAPVQNTNRSCQELVSSYTAPNGVVYNVACDTFPGSYAPLDFPNAASFEQCLVQCSLSSDCKGALWESATLTCATFSAVSGGPSEFDGVDAAVKVES